MADNISLLYLTDLAVASEASQDDLLHINQSGSDRSITVNLLLRAMVDYVMPVGRIIFESTNVNPNTVYPGTTWVRLPDNRMIRTASENGLDVMQTSGSDSVTLSVANLPAHTHGVALQTSQIGDHTHAITVASGGAHTHTGSTGSSGAHTHSLSGTAAAAGAHQHANGIRNPGNYGGSGGLHGIRGVGLGSGAWAQGGSQVGSESLTSSDGAHTHSISGTAASSGAHTHTVSIATGGAHSHTASAAGSGAHTHTVNGDTESTGSGSSISVVSAHVKLIGWRRTA